MGCSIALIMKVSPPENKRTTLSFWLDAMGILLLGLLWIFVLMTNFNLPDQIPIHFNLSGTPDGFGARQTLFFLPAVATLLLILLTVINRRPERFNYPVTITAENAAYQYQLASNLIRVLKLAMPIIFGLIAVVVMESPDGHPSPLLPLLLPIILGITFIPLFIYLILATRN